MATFGISENIGTFTLSGQVVTIIREFSVSNISMLLVSGVVTVTGIMNLGAISSTPITLVADKPLNLGSISNFPIDGLTIDATGGSVTIITGK